ncbi:MAG: DnaB-like helicase C-terminal domain-containing protein [Candidatus Sulfotelmatobacter sp.]
MTAQPIFDIDPTRDLGIDLGRELPAITGAERSILGAILLDARAFNEAAEILKPEDFSLDSHRRIYRAMVGLTESGRPVDVVLLVEELDRQRELEPIGGHEYIASLVEGVPDRPSIAHYIRIVKEKAQLRGLISAAQVAIARALDSEKATEIAGGLLQTVLDIEAQAQTNHALTARDFMPEVLRELEMQAQSGGLVGLPTGLDPLDLVTGGLRKGELIVIGALPGAGKTALACQIIAENAASGNPVGVFSLEMSRWDLGKRFLSTVTSVTASKIRHPHHIKKEDWPALATGAAEIAQWPVWFDDSGTVSIPELLARARLFITRMKAKLIIVDYLQLVRADARDIRERVGKVADALRQLAKAERIPVVLLSQLRRPHDVNDPPTIVDLKESGDIEAHAHVVLLIHSPVAADGQPLGEDVVIVAKNRNGSRGPVPVTFSPHKLRFYPRAVERGYQPEARGQEGSDAVP